MGPGEEGTFCCGLTFENYCRRFRPSQSPKTDSMNLPPSFPLEENTEEPPFFETTMRATTQNAANEDAKENRSTDEDNFGQQNGLFLV